MAEAAGANGMEQRRHTLLVVDDEVDVLESLRHQFHRGYRVLTSASGQQAIEILLNEDVELILTDQRMPGMSGDQFLREARRLKPDAIRMLFTGYADIQAVISAVNEGHIFRYILKPWDSAELEAIIRQGVEQYELLAERKRLVAELQAANRELVQANDELARAGQLKTAFIEVASHEFNTPITLVLGLTELLRLCKPITVGPGTRDSSPDHHQRQATGSARHQHADLASRRRLSQNPGTQPVRSGRSDRAGRRPGPAVHPRAPASSSRLRLADDLGTFEIDADKISAVLINLLTNAIKFTPDGGTIELTARLSEPDVAEIMRERSRRRPGAAGAPALVPAVFHPARPQPPFIGRFRLLQARAGAWLEYCKTIRGDAWWTDQRREPGRWRNTGHGLSAALRKCCGKASGS